MMKNLLALALLFFCSTAYAETVRVYTDYKPVRIIHLVDGTNFDLEASKAGLAGAYVDIDSSTLPKNRVDRDAWVFSKGVVAIDAAKKATLDAAVAKKESDKASAITKLKSTGLTDDELEALGIGGDRV